MSLRGLKKYKLGIYYWLQKKLYTVWKRLLTRLAFLLLKPT